MSYQLSGAPVFRGARPQLRAGRLPNRRPTVFHMPIQGGAGNIVRPIVRQPGYGALQSAYGLGDYDELGFSLKPPKWLRKMQPGKVLLKAAPVIAGVGAALLIPGVAPAGAALFKGAGGLALRGAGALVRGGAAAGRGVFGLLRPVAKTAAGILAPAGGGTPGIVPEGTAPIPMLPQAAPSTPITYAGQPDFSSFMPSGGGGGGFAAPAAASSDQAAAPAPSSNMPLILGGLGAVALIMFATRRSR